MSQSLEKLYSERTHEIKATLRRTGDTCVRSGVGPRAPRTLPQISQETLAEMIGATRPRVNFFMNTCQETDNVNKAVRMDRIVEFLDANKAHNGNVAARLSFER